MSAALLGIAPLRLSRRFCDADYLFFTPSPLALLIAESSLRIEPSLFRRAAGLRSPALLRHDERLAHQRRQAPLGALTVLPLTPPITRDDANVSLAVETRRKLVQHALTLFLGERSRRRDIPEQLYACR